MVMRNPVHPGEVLREDVLADLGLGVGEAASRLGVSRVTLSRVLHGHARVSPNLAVRLEVAGVGTARGWLAMQTAYDLAAERDAGVPKVRRLDDDVAHPDRLVKRIDRLLHDDFIRRYLDPHEEEDRLFQLAAEWELLSAYVVGQMSSKGARSPESWELIRQQILTVAALIGDLPPGPEKMRLEGVVQALADALLKFRDAEAER